MWLRAGVLAFAFGIALCAPLGAAAATVRVTGDAALTAALALALPGDVIQMAPGAYGTVTIAARGGLEADLTLAGEPGASVAGMNITGSTRLVMTGLSVAPAGVTAYINVASSNGVTFSNLHLDGGAGGAGAAIWLTPDALGVVIKDSTFLHCASPMCIRASSPDVLIEHNVFDELDDSDAVHGFGGGVIRGNHMDHALPHGGGNHNDFIQIGAGGPWTIDRNWFGVRTGGAASIWLDPINGGLIHDAVIENNVVTGHYAGQYVGIFVGGDGTPAALLPRNITVINNTVISGLSNSLRFGRAYATLPLEQRPLVVNNTGERLLEMCDRIRSGHNVFAVGQACSATDVIGNPHLDATGAPTAASALLIDHGDPSVAPPADFFGYARTVGAPDIGAIEFGATAAAPVKVHVRASFVSVRVARRLHRIVVRVRAANATRVTATVLRNGRIVARATHAGSARSGVKFTLAAPRHGKLVVRIRAFGPGGGALRVVTPKARP
jgi:hypothetical protein